MSVLKVNMTFLNSAVYAIACDMVLKLNRYTNLPQHKFPTSEIKQIYAMRWGIETSFRKLKYTIGLSYFHAKKREYIDQEIFARLIMYNFVEMITAYVVISQDERKFLYQANFTIATCICRRFLWSWSNAPPPDVEAVIRKHILPIRPERKFVRNIRSQSAISFFYRVA